MIILTTSQIFSSSCWTAFHVCMTFPTLHTVYPWIPWHLFVLIIIIFLYDLLFPIFSTLLLLNCIMGVNLNVNLNGVILIDHFHELFNAIGSLRTYLNHWPGLSIVNFATTVTIVSFNLSTCSFPLGIPEVIWTYDMCVNYYSIFWTVRYQSCWITECSL